MAQTKNIEIFLENAVTSDPHNLLLGDPFRLKQILLNLLSNSVKFTQSLGSITVRWKIEKAGSSGESRVTLSVVDTVSLIQSLSSPSGHHLIISVVFSLSGCRNPASE